MWNRHSTFLSFLEATRLVLCTQRNYCICYSGEITVFVTPLVTRHLDYRDFTVNVYILRRIPFLAEYSFLSSDTIETPKNTDPTLVNTQTYILVKHYQYNCGLSKQEKTTK